MSAAFGVPDSDPAAPSPARRHLAMLLASAQQMYGAAALTALLILDRGVEAEVWPQRWAAAFDRQAAIAERLRALGPAAVERLRWPLLEVCASTLRPMALPWRDDLLRMLRGQIELDQRVTLGEWIYYMLLRTRIVAAHGVAWRGDERDANPAQAVRWVVTVLGHVAGEPALRGERAAHEVIRALGLPRTGQSHPPLDVGGLQSAVASLRQIPMLQRPLLMRRLVAFLPEDAPIEGRDFLRVLALIIDCPPPVFTPLRLSTPDTIGMPTERSLPAVDRAAAGPETVAMPERFADTVAFPPTVTYAPPATGLASVPRAAATPALVD